ncbi:MAG: BLUF domain-containing protein [Alphaproteobacteria bacterium]|nr:BLUF domain-containing protein [Alphaproteobacteria bacterium]
MAERIRRVVYRSKACETPTEDDLWALLDDARARNQAVGLTGVLLYDEGAYLQVLEGRPEAIDRLLASIACDPRHVDMTILGDESDRPRLFGDWSMAFIPWDAETERRMHGLGSFRGLDALAREAGASSKAAARLFRAMVETVRARSAA